uniref:N-ethylmaleimide-sensitive factor attachment protein, beta b n=1 Tax=Gadus morhua TaxID=8049 RepID=A0A8C5A9C0_GADMO
RVPLINRVLPRRLLLPLLPPSCLQPRGRPSARLRGSTASCRTSTTVPPASSTQGTPTRRSTQTGRFTIAAKHHINIAEIYEAELVDIEKAIAHYEQAADYYKGEESNSSANKCLLKVGAYSAQLEQYAKAIEIYEQVGSNTMDNPLLKYSAKEYFFKASLCHFIVDELNAKVRAFGTPAIRITFRAFILLKLWSTATCNHSCTHSHTDGGVNHARRQPARQERSWGDISLWDTSTRKLGGAGDRTSNLSVTTRLVLSNSTRSTDATESIM